MNTAQPGKRRVCVIGAGVVGLSTAVRILEDSKTWGVSGVEVTVVADQFSPHTTSDGSGGFWGPFIVEDTPVPLVRKWSEATWRYMSHLARSASAATVGAQFVSGYLLSDSPTFQDPSFKDSVLGYRRLTPEEISMFPTARSGIFMTVVQINVQKYLPWLMQRFKSSGGQAEFGTVQDLAQVAEKYDVVVNCGGLRAGQLVTDPHTFPIRGQLRRIQAPWIKHFYMIENTDGSCSYVLPLGEEVLVGGVAQKHSCKEEVDKGDSESIWSRALIPFPFLQGGRTLREWAGLRPGRSTVRLDKEDLRSPSGRAVPVVHNYGHGGSGVTLHWGCAADAADLVRSALLRPPPPPHSKL